MRKQWGARPAALVLLVSVVATAGAEPAAADDIRESQGFRRG